MKGNLLDTNMALIALVEPRRLGVKQREAIFSGANFLSVVSYWEVVLKSMKGKLKLQSPLTWWPDALDELKAIALPLRPEHISEIQNLPPVHQDPFDRVLIAQAIAEKLVLITTDREIVKYNLPRLTVLSGN